MNIWWQMTLDMSYLTSTVSLCSAGHARIQRIRLHLVFNPSLELLDIQSCVRGFADLANTTVQDLIDVSVEHIAAPQRLQVVTL